MRTKTLWICLRYCIRIFFILIIKEIHVVVTCDNRHRYKGARPRDKMLCIKKKRNLAERNKMIINYMYIKNYFRFTMPRGTILPWTTSTGMTRRSSLHLLRYSQFQPDLRLSWGSVHCSYFSNLTQVLFAVSIRCISRYGQWMRGAFLWPKVFSHLCCFTQTRMRQPRWRAT